jgi:flavin reductase (DIM6/NTAB) family NADH-FMN oxidoreductase RutF
MEERGFNPAEFCKACSRFVTGITVVTSIKCDGAPVGVTVSSFTSVSLKPPLVLVCLHHESKVLDHVLASGRFGLNILASHQEEFSSRFAGRLQDRFEGLSWHPGSTGVPLLCGVLATLECTLDRCFPAGDHQIVIGRVITVASEEGSPLVRFSSGYRSLPMVHSDGALRKVVG